MSYRRPIRLVVLTLLLLGLAAAQAAAWGPGVHAYVADHAGKWWPSLNRIEVYGAVLPDMCYFASGPDGFPEACAVVVHDLYYGAVWDGAYDLSTRALGYGYESHHETDKTAHEAGILFGRKQGYVVQKASVFSVALAASLEAALELEPGSVPPASVEPLAHNMVEVGTDIMIKRVDPLIGNRLLMAAVLRGPFVPEQLVSLYSSELDDEDLVAAESQFRMAMFAYGLALMESESDAIVSLAQLLAPLAPSWIPLSDEELVPLIGEALVGAMALCERDFPYELRATTAAVRWRLWLQGVWY